MAWGWHGGGDEPRALCDRVRVSPSKVRVSPKCSEKLGEFGAGSSMLCERWRRLLRGAQPRGDSKKVQEGTDTEVLTERGWGALVGTVRTKVEKQQKPCLG